MNHPKILIIEDDEDLQTLYGLYLQGESFEIFRAFNGAQGFDFLEKVRPDLIVLDMIMPVMDGEQFLTRLHAEKKVADIPIIIASVNDKIPAHLLAISNVRATLKKPFTIETLVAKIRKTLTPR